MIQIFILKNRIINKKSYEIFFRCIIRFKFIKFVALSKYCVHHLFNFIAELKLLTIYNHSLYHAVKLNDDIYVFYFLINIYDGIGRLFKQVCKLVSKS